MKSPTTSSTNFAPRFDEPLADKTSFRVGGPAAVFVACASLPHLRDARRLARARKLPLYLLGAGTNLLVHDRPLPAVVARLAGPEFAALSFSDNVLSAGAAVPLPRLLGAAARRSLAGLHPLTGIPGSLGGALCMNAGANNAAIGDLVVDVTVLDAHDRVSVIPSEDAAFAYRESRLSEHVVLSVRLRLEPGDRDEIARETRRFRRKRRASQPWGVASAGCVFRNPPGASAGALIDACGLKGARVGGACVSPKHANFIVNDGSASAADVLRLIRTVRSSVRRETGVSLDLEITLWPLP